MGHSGGQAITFMAWSQGVTATLIAGSMPQHREYVCNHHIIYPLYTLYTPLYTLYTFFTIFTIFTPTYTRYTPHVHLTRL